MKFSFFNGCVKTFNDEPQYKRKNIKNGLMNNPQMNECILFIFLKLNLIYSILNFMTWGV